MKISRFELMAFFITFVCFFLGLVLVNYNALQDFDFLLALIISFCGAIATAIWATITHKRKEKKIEKMREKMD